jgi:anti-sigma regulatory factor (Ser/Thr protein kinase)
MARQQDPTIREFILQNIEAHQTDVSALIVQKFGVSRTSAVRYLDRLIEQGLVSAEGNTRARRYKLKPISNEYFHREPNGRWTEDNVWRENILPLMKGVKQNIIDICQYGVTEIVNNVLDHSQSPTIDFWYTQTYTTITIFISDSGIGIFNKIQHDFKLDDAQTALLELVKGKLTSNKREHSGEGIYFTSRMFDQFTINAGHLFYGRSRRDGDDWLIETSERSEETLGTSVRMVIGVNAAWTTREVFDKYQGEDIKFRKTHIPILLGRYRGEQLVSRSQARRILARVNEFSEVILDFDGVGEIGQAFADEIFRVFMNQHPGTSLVALNTNEDIDKTIKYVQTAASGVHSPTQADLFWKQ